MPDQQNDMQLAHRPSGLSATPVRDPRVDPRPGDVLRGFRNGKEIQREVMESLQWIVRVRLPNGRKSSWWRRHWASWAKNAEVLHVSTEGPANQKEQR